MSKRTRTGIPCCAPMLIALLATSVTAQQDITDIRSKVYSLKPDTLQYLLIASTGKLETPPDGYKLLVVLPGGDGMPTSCRL